RPTTNEDAETRGQGDKERWQSPISNLQSPDNLETQHSTRNTQNSQPPTTEDLSPFVVRRSSFVAESVHLAPWPVADAALIDEELLDSTALLLDAVSLGRAARREAGLKLRQPLGRLWLRAPAAAVEALRRFEADL